MAIPEIVEDVIIKASGGRLWAYIGEKMLGRVETINGKIVVFPSGRQFREGASLTPYKSPHTAAGECGAAASGDTN